ncbi:MAG: hypothetical protein GC203_01145 [Phenylobacterium sp.]|uniref:DUF6882 domain-containing protein n=1 Tax=Phenylobacterium sp. TaxID=1871053 RepID=UPI0025F7F659|nr:DUF6882 domain-containing protein [Phenylobacterium sp.]MBI1196449.1 hypothetical protein [Phenylobacterium sp.]
MKAPDWYDAWCEEAFADFSAKQNRNAEAFRLESWLRYDYDTQARTLTFSDEQGPRVVADIQVVGRTGAVGWLWGWGDPAWPPASVEAMGRVRDFGAENGVEELTTDFLKSDDLEGAGWMLTAIAARILEAEGGYRAQSANGAVYFLLQSIKFVS